MGGMLSYSGLVTKARAMEARLLSKEDYERIAAMESVVDFIGFLKERPGYGELFAKREEASFHRNEIEGILMYSLIQDYLKLYRFCNQEQRKLFVLVFWRIETDILKQCLYRIVDGASWEAMSGFVEFMDKHSEVDMEAMQRAKNIEGFLDALKGSPYEKLFGKLEGQNKLELHFVEERLDIYCFLRIWQTIEKSFQGKDKKALMDVYGKRIDLLNILWLYRAKKYYSSGKLKAEPATIPVCYKLRKEELRKLAECYTIEEFLQVLGTTYYSGLKEESSVEQFYKEGLAHAYQENHRKYPYSMSAVYSLIYQKKREIDRLTTALECIRYQLDANVAVQYILQQ